MCIFLKIILCIFSVYGFYRFIYDIFHNDYVKCKQKEKEDGDDRNRERKRKRRSGDP